jgi:hypothetical protein
MVALRTPNLVQVCLDAGLQVMGMLVDRRDEPGCARTQTINRLHRLLLELVHGGAKKFLSAAQARALIATVKPRDLVGKTRRRLVVELIGDLERIDRTIKAADKDLKALVPARGSTLMRLHGIGACDAARLLADLGDIRRFADRDRFASWNGTAPLDASSGQQQRHRLSRAGNRHIKRAVHIMAVAQLCHRTPGRAYFDARKAAGKTSMEAMRALKRPLSNVIYACMVAPTRKDEKGRARRSGRTSGSPQPRRVGSPRPATPTGTSSIAWSSRTWAGRSSPTCGDPDQHLGGHAAPRHAARRPGHVRLPRPPGAHQGSAVELSRVPAPVPARPGGSRPVRRHPARSAGHSCELGG